MSTVRMCDWEGPEGPCNTIFSERLAGWSTGTMTVVDDDGKKTTVQADFCPSHTTRPQQRRGSGTVKMLVAGDPLSRPAAPPDASDPRDWTAFPVSEGF